MSTAASIRDAMLSELESLTPTVQANFKFRRYHEEADFRDWATENPQSCFRRVSIRDIGSFDGPPISAGDHEWVATTFEVVTAYPKDFRYGKDMSRDRDDLIEQDELQIHNSIGTTGYSALDVTTGGDASVVTGSRERETGGPVVFLVFRLDVQFWRQLPGV